MTEKSPSSVGVAPDSNKQEPFRGTSPSGHIAREIAGVGKTDCLQEESTLKHSEPSARRPSLCEMQLLLVVRKRYLRLPQRSFMVRMLLMPPRFVSAVGL